MRLWNFAILTLVAAALAGCGMPWAAADGVNPAGHRGRYGAVGVYGPSRQWTRLLGARISKDPQAARLIDDQVIIVVQDTASGEVRACGDLTGYCIGMNPWKTALLAAQIAPPRLSAHVEPDDPNMTVKVETKPAKPGKKTHSAD